MHHASRPDQSLSNCGRLLVSTFAFAFVYGQAERVELDKYFCHLAVKPDSRRCHEPKMETSGSEPVTQHPPRHDQNIQMPYWKNLRPRKKGS
jgi:hypothetical protein